MNRLWWLLLPIMVILFAMLGYGLTSDPKKIPSPLINKPFPVIKGVDLAGNEVSLGGKAMPRVINVWASWCVSCRAEHEILLRSAKRFAGKVELIGIDYKENQQIDGRNWLRRLGNPYVWTLDDQTGRAGLELGVVAVPETFFVNSEGIIKHKIAGPLSDETFADGVKRIAEGSPNPVGTP